MPDASRPRPEHEVDDHDQPERVVRCGACGREIARVADRIVVGTGDLHTFVNPQGEVFELACFSRADGAVAHGEPTLQFTWFPGHAWRYAGCRGCGAQLGWHFTGAASFWGLVRRALRWP